MNPANVSKEWPGYNRLKYLFIFGDSYSSVRSEPYQTPTEERPLGVEFPGNAWVEELRPNWVGHLINKYYPEGPLLVYDYAIGGNNIYGVRRQVERYRQRGSPGHPDSEECWQGNNSLFDAQSTADTFFELQEELYDTGARNFLFMTTAPLPNSSNGQRSLFQQREDRCKSWNATVTSRAQSDFAQAHPDASVFMFDAHATFDRMLENPTEHGFSAKAGRGGDQEMYWDAIHPTSAVHRIVAKAVAEFLTGEAMADDKPERFATVD